MVSSVPNSTLALRLALRFSLQAAKLRQEDSQATWAPGRQARWYQLRRCVSWFVTVLCPEILTEEISKIESGRAWLTDTLHIFVTFGCFSREYELSLRQKNELIEQRYDVTPRLMDRKHYSAVIIPCEGHQTINNTERVIRIET